MKPILIIKTGTTYPDIANRFCDFEDWTMSYACLTRKDILVIEVFNGQDIPLDNSYSGVIITGSHSNVTDDDNWSKKVADWIPRLIEKSIPLLGICYGHQLLAHAMGGKVGFHPRGREISTVDISLIQEGKNDPLLKHLPSIFPAQVAHSQSVFELPESAVVLAKNDFEPIHAFRIKDCAWGIQFHPEFSKDVMRAYIDEQRDALNKEGFNINKLHDQVGETPEAHHLLKRFVSLIRKK